MLRGVEGDADWIAARLVLATGLSVAAEGLCVIEGWIQPQGRLQHIAGGWLNVSLDLHSMADFQSFLSIFVAIPGASEKGHIHAAPRSQLRSMTLIQIAALLAAIEMQPLLTYLQRGIACIHDCHLLLLYSIGCNVERRRHADQVQNWWQETLGLPIQQIGVSASMQSPVCCRGLAPSIELCLCARCWHI